MLDTNQTPYTPQFLLAQGPTGSGGGVEGDDQLAFIRDKRLRILLVDDREDYRVGMKFMLTEKYDAEVEDVDSGPEAVEAVRGKDVFDLIFLDVRMWPMDGFETYRELKAIDPGCYVVTMSANAGNKEFEEADKLGVELLHKPILDDTMTLILSRVGRRRP